MCPRRALSPVGRHLVFRIYDFDVAPQLLLPVQLNRTKFEPCWALFHRRASRQNLAGCRLLPFFPDRTFLKLKHGEIKDVSPVDTCDQLLVLFVHVVRTVRNKSSGVVMNTTASKKILSGAESVAPGGFDLGLEIVVVTHFGA